MMWPAWIAMAALVAALLAVHRARRPRLEWAVKPLAAAVFVVTAIVAGAFETAFGTVMFVGLCLAALGDVLLIPKDRRAFLAGLIAFLLGHVGYAIAFAVRGVDVAFIGAALAGLALVTIPVLRWLWPHVEGKMRAPVVAYVVVITGMVALAVGTVAAEGDPRLLIGAVGFYLSDLSVARDRFVKKELTNKLWGLPLYFFSQLLLAVSV